MIRVTLKPWAYLSLIAVIIWPAFVSAKTSTDKNRADLSILEQRDALLPYMTATQKIEYLKLEAAVASAESDLRSGQHMANTKPSSFNPDRDIKPMIERGTQLILDSRAAIEAKQIEMAQLLSAVSAQRSQQYAVDLTKYDYTLESTDLETALAAQSRALLEACWEQGYDTLFFDNVFIRDNEGTHRVDAAIRNHAYDALIQVDGTTFSVTIPINFQLDSNALGNSADIFSYENATIFEGDKKALLVIECILPTGSSTGLLSMRAVDLKTQLITAHELVKVDDLARALNLQSEDNQDRIAGQLQLRDLSQTIDLFSRMSTPYTFELANDPSLAAITAQLTHTLVKHSNLKIVDSDFIMRGYGQTLEEPEAWTGQANASITVNAADQEGSYQVSAQANNSNRTLPIGILTLRP